MPSSERQARVDTKASAGPSTSSKAAAKAKALEEVRKTTGFAFFTDLVDSLYARPEAESFRQPVFELWTEEAMPGYRDTIETPMDLGTIKGRLKDGFYNLYQGNRWDLNEDAVANDIIITFRNCMLYNEEDSVLYAQAKDLLDQATEEFKERSAARKTEALERERARKERRAQQDRERRAKQRKEKEEKEAAEKERKRIKDKERREKMQREKRLREEEDRKKEEERRKRAAEAARIAAEEAQKKKAEMLANGKRPIEGANGVEPEKKKKVRRDFDERSTSSLSDDEAAEYEEEHDLVGGDDVQELTIQFVSVKGYEKKRGRKSALAMQLEAKHEELLRKRRTLVAKRTNLNQKKMQEMTDEEKNAVCMKIRSYCDAFMQRHVCEIIARGMNMPELLNENEIDVSLDRLSNQVLRELESFVENPVVYRMMPQIAELEKTLTEIETEYIGLRYQPATR